MRSPHRMKGVYAALVGLSLATGAAGCSDDPSSSGSGGSGGSGGEGGGSGGEGGGGGSGGSVVVPPALRHLDPSFEWYGENATRIDALLDQKGSEHPDYDVTKKPVAIFDWDNTVIKNDVGDVVMFWMLKNDKILQPPGKSWAATSPYLTAPAIAKLEAACSALADEGQPLPTSMGTASACADEIVNIYYNSATVAEDDAFAGWNYRTMEPAYAWAVQLQAGYTPEEVRGFASKAIAEATAAEIGAVQTVGTVADLNAYLRIYDPIKDLIGALQTDGFDVWILSASSQPVVETFAAEVNVAAGHVVGVRAIVDTDGKLSYDLQGCGSVPDGSGKTGNSMITYIDGKRCWMNKIIYGDTSASAEKRTADEALRPVFGAGDSDTDVSFLQDATVLRLALNRNKKELMCNAYANGDGRWLINPMFIKPKGELTDGYACSKNACKDKGGASVPCVDETGKTIPDQVDSIFCKDGVYCTK